MTVFVVLQHVSLTSSVLYTLLMQHFRAHGDDSLHMQPAKQVFACAPRATTRCMLQGEEWQKKCKQEFNTFNIMVDLIQNNCAIPEDAFVVAALQLQQVIITEASKSPGNPQVLKLLQDPQVNSCTVNQTELAFTRQELAELT